MKNKYDNLYLFLSFLPLALLPMSVPIAILLTSGLLLYGIHYQSQARFKKALNPLTLSLVFAVLLGTVQISLQIFTLFRQAIPTTGINNFVFVMTSIFRIFNIILLFILIAGTILAISAVVSNKKMPFLHKLITFFEKRKETQDTEEDNEIIIDEED